MTPGTGKRVIWLHVCFQAYMRLFDWYWFLRSIMWLFSCFSSIQAFQGQLDPELSFLVPERILRILRSRTITSLEDSLLSLTSARFFSRWIGGWEELAPVSRWMKLEQQYSSENFHWGPNPDPSLLWPHLRGAALQNQDGNKNKMGLQRGSGVSESGKYLVPWWWGGSVPVSLPPNGPRARTSVARKTFIFYWGVKRCQGRKWEWGWREVHHAHHHCFLLRKERKHQDKWLPEGKGRPWAKCWSRTLLNLGKV